MYFIYDSNKYLKEVIGHVWDLIALHFKLKYKLQVSELKVELSKRFMDYNKEKAKVSVAISRFGTVPEEGLGKSFKIISMDVGLLKRNLREAFEGVMDATVDLRF